MTRLRDLVQLEHPGRFQLPAWIDRLVSAGIVSGDPKVVRRQKIVNAAALASAFNSTSRLLANFVHGSEDYLLAQLVATILAVAALLVHRLHRFGDNAGIWGMLLVFSCSVTSGAFLFGLQSQVQVYFVLTAILWFMFGVEQWRTVVVLLCVMAANMIAVIQFAPFQGPAVISQAAGLMAIQSMINSLAINSVMLFYALFLLQRAESELQRQTRRAEALVSVVLPNAVAERLRVEPDRRIADRLDGVSILFADLAGFTEAAHQEPPEAVVAYLDEFVRTFDDMCERQGIEKIKTIGDAYMAAGGLRGDSIAGAVAIGKLALAMSLLQAARPPLGDRKLKLRVGIHLGTAIAGVIGDTRISYDLWGDAVNVASRMETHGEPGRIHVSDAFRHAVAEGFDFQERGATAIKGIGIERTHFLLAAREL